MLSNEIYFGHYEVSWSPRWYTFVIRHAMRHLLGNYSLFCWLFWNRCALLEFLLTLWNRKWKYSVTSWSARQLIDHKCVQGTSWWNPDHINHSPPEVRELYYLCHHIPNVFNNGRYNNVFIGNMKTIMTEALRNTGCPRKNILLKLYCLDIYIFGIFGEAITSVTHLPSYGTI